MLKECPQCRELGMKAVMTEQGAVVDCCPKCLGIWLDKAEIYLFAKDTRSLKEEIEEG